MSFSADTKNELAHVEPEKKCCMLAEIAGFIRCLLYTSDAADD